MTSELEAPEWIAISEAGADLQLSYNQVLRLVMRGDLGGKRDGLRWWVARRSVEAFGPARRRARTAANGEAQKVAEAANSPIAGAPRVRRSARGR